MISLIPMAGQGSRFKEAGYQLPKPFIPIMNMPMFMAAIRSFPRSDRYLLVCQKEFVRRYSFQKQVEQYLSSCEVLTVDGLTEGQACTCLVAEDRMDPNDMLMISSCDYQLVYDEEAHQQLFHDPTIDVIVWTFQTGAITKKSPEAFAYCRTMGNHVLEVVEKRTISETPHLDPAVTGTFTYRRVSDFLYGAKMMIQKNIRINGEFYVGTSINQLIEIGKKVVVFPVKKFISFGDPFELQLYQAWEEFFFNEESHPYHG